MTTGPRRRRSPSKRAPRSGRPKVHLRRASVRDLDLLVFHRRRMWEDILRSATPSRRVMDGADREYRTWARGRFRARRYVAWIAEDGTGDALGSGCLWLMDAGQPRPGRGAGTLLPYLLSMYTDPRARGLGIATRIVTEALRWSRAHGHRVVLLHASKFGRSVYGRLGFRRGWEMFHVERSPSHARKGGRRG